MEVCVCATCLERDRGVVTDAFMCYDDLNLTTLTTF